MENKINQYLEKVNSHLRPLTISERTDILNEIKSHINEMRIEQNLEIDSILEKLGDPVSLAKAYVGEIVTTSNNFSLKNLFRLFSFYTIAGFSGIVVVPTVSILSATFYFSAFIIPVAGFIKTAAHLINIEMPYMMFNLGFWEVPAILSFFVSIPFGLLFYYLGKKMWKFLQSYLASFMKKHDLIKRGA